MNQPFENGLPEGQANPFASPTSMAVATAYLFLSLVACILSFASAFLFCMLRERIGRNISSSRLEKIAGSLLVWYVILLIVVLVGGGIMSFDVFNNDRANRTNLLSDNAQLLLGPVWVLATFGIALTCLLYTSPSPRDATLSRMPSSA